MEAVEPVRLMRRGTDGSARPRRLWKALRLAGLAGVAATGAIIARDQRQRAQLTPAEVRARLRSRIQDTGIPHDDPHDDPRV